MFKRILGCPWNLVTIVSKLGYDLFRGLTTYLYWGYNLVTKYHGHPSRIVGSILFQSGILLLHMTFKLDRIRPPDGTSTDAFICLTPQVGSRNDQIEGMETSLKLTASLPLKMDGTGRRSFPFGMAYFQVRTVSVREGNPSSVEFLESLKGTPSMPFPLK